MSLTCPVTQRPSGVASRALGWPSGDLNNGGGSGLLEGVADVARLVHGDGAGVFHGLAEVTRPLAYWQFKVHLGVSAMIVLLARPPASNNVMDTGTVAEPSAEETDGFEPPRPKV